MTVLLSPHLLDEGRSQCPCRQARMGQITLPAPARAEALTSLPDYDPFEARLHLTSLPPAQPSFPRTWLPFPPGVIASPRPLRGGGGVKMIGRGRPGPP
jgi:hypothetical protein